MYPYRMYPYQHDPQKQACDAEYDTGKQSRRRKSQPDLMLPFRDPAGKKCQISLLQFCFFPVYLQFPALLKRDHEHEPSILRCINAACDPAVAAGNNQVCHIGGMAV